MLYFSGLIVMGVWVTYIVTRSYLLIGVRDKISSKYPILGYALECPVCFGTWVGVLLAIITVLGIRIPNHIFIIPSVSLASYILVLCTDLLSEITRWHATADHKHQDSGK